MAAKLTAKQQQFIMEYLVDLNASAAAVRAGYAKKSAEVEGHRLLRNANIAAEIASKRLERCKRTQITADYVLTRLQEVAERCLQAEPVTDREGNETGEYRFDSSGANKSLELLGKHLKLFTDKTELTGENAGPLKIKVTITDE